MNKYYEEEDIRAIATSIKAKSGDNTPLKISEMSTAIDNIPTGR